MVLGISGGRRRRGLGSFEVGSGTEKGEGAGSGARLWLGSLRCFHFKESFPGVVFE